MNVLIVDDEIGLAEMISDILASAGHHVTMASNGALGLVMLDEQRFDLILLDVMMPIMAGEEMLRALRARDDSRDVPVIMMSAAGPQSITDESRQTIAGFLHKPFTIHQLDEAMARAFGAAMPSEWATTRT